MAHNVELGRRGEDLAAAHLRACGMTMVERNGRCARGEIDIIAHDGDETVFVEVKTRSGGGWGHPFESITPAKVARLRRLAAAGWGERGGGGGRGGWGGNAEFEWMGSWCWLRLTRQPSSSALKASADGRRAYPVDCTARPGRIRCGGGGGSVRPIARVCYHRAARHRAR